MYAIHLLPNIIQMTSLMRWFLLKCYIYIYIYTLYIVILQIWINPSLQRWGEPCGSFFSTCFYLSVSSIWGTLCLVSCLPSLLLLTPTALSFDLCCHNSLQAAFIKSSHHMTMPSQSGLWYGKFDHTPQH